MQQQFSPSATKSATGRASPRPRALQINIRAMRYKRGWTLAKLADLVGISIPHLSEIERGQKNLNNHLLLKIAAALNTTPESLIASEYDQSLDHLRDIMADLSEDDRRRVEQFAAALGLASSPRT